MVRFFEKLRLFFMPIMVAAAMALSLAGVCSCAEDEADDGLGENGFKIVGTSTNSDGTAVVSCDKRKNSVSLIFNVRDSYIVTVDGYDWLSIASGETGEAGNSRSLKINVAENKSGEVRFGVVSILIGKNKECKLATVTQTASTSNAIVDWMDERLSKEYYWLTEYNKMRDEGKIDYSLTGQKFLDGALLNMGTVNLADGYIGNDGKRRLFTYIHESSATKAIEGTQKVSGYGFEMCYTIISFQNSSNYAFLLEHVYPGSPADMVGFKRGDLITMINNSAINGSNYENLFNMLQFGGNGAISVTKRTGVVDDKEVTVTLDVAMGEYYQTPIACNMILKENAEYGFVFGDKKIGYISYLSFDGDFDDELIYAMKDMERAGVTDLIIDLRTNGGGSVYSSVYFASMLLPESYVGKNMVTLKRHKDNLNGDDVIPFVNEVQLSKTETLTLPHLNLSKVCFITSDDTASASEMLIMALRAQGVEATTVGTQSLGKDCGMDVMAVVQGSTRYEFAPITFMNLFEGYDVDFSDGIPADRDFSVLKDHLKDEDMADALDWYPLPELYVSWGDYLSDIGLGEAVANILGGSIFDTSAEESKLWRKQPATRASAVKKQRAVEMAKPAKMGMYLMEHEREMLREKKK